MRPTTTACGTKGLEEAEVAPSRSPAAPQKHLLPGQPVLGGKRDTPQALDTAQHTPPGRHRGGRPAVPCPRHYEAPELKLGGVGTLRSGGGPRRASAQRRRASVTLGRTEATLAITPQPGGVYPCEIALMFPYEVLPRTCPYTRNAYAVCGLKNLQAK